MGWGATAQARGHAGAVTALDFSADGRFLQSTDDLGALLFWEAKGLRAGEEVRAHLSLI